MLLNKLVGSLLKLVPKKDRRKGILGLHLQRRGDLSIATALDGKVLAELSWKDEKQLGDFPEIDGVSALPVPKFEVTLPTEAVTQALKGVGRSSAMPILNHVLVDETAPKKGAPRRVKLATTDLDTHITRDCPPIEEGAYPSTESVLGPVDADESALLDSDRYTLLAWNPRQAADYLATLAEMVGDQSVYLCVPRAPFLDRGSRTIQVRALPQDMWESVGRLRGAFQPAVVEDQDFYLAQAFHTTREDVKRLVPEVSPKKTPAGD